MISFFKKKSTLILFMISTIIFAGLYVFMMINPVSYIGSYHTKMEAFGMESEMTYKFKSGNKVECTESGEFGEMSASETVEQWYFRKGDRVIFMGTTETVTKEMYEEAVKAYKKMSDKEFEAVSSKISYGELSYQYVGLNYKFENTMGSLVNTLVMILAVVTGAGTVISLVFNMFSKKSKKTAQPQADNQL